MRFLFRKFLFKLHYSDTHPQTITTMIYANFFYKYLGILAYSVTISKLFFYRNFTFNNFNACNFLEISFNYFVKHVFC